MRRNRIPIYCLDKIALSVATLAWIVVAALFFAGVWHIIDKGCS